MKTKLIVFDMDGVLVDCKEMHFIAFNEALSEFGYKPLSIDDHLKNYDGLNTLAKMVKVGVVDKHRTQLFDSKQRRTVKLMESIPPDYRLERNLQQLFDDGYILNVASNSIRHTVDVVLERLGIYDLIGGSLSNEDVSYPKPNPAIYLKCMADNGKSPYETLIIEDSDVGCQASGLSGADTLRVKDSSEVTYENIIAHCNIN